MFIRYTILIFFLTIFPIGASEYLIDSRKTPSLLLISLEIFVSIRYLTFLIILIYVFFKCAIYTFEMSPGEYFNNFCTLQ